jgi:hypothetical protein
VACAVLATARGMRFMRRKDHGQSGSASYAWSFSSDLQDWETSSKSPSWYQAPSILSEDETGTYDLLEVPFPATLSNGRTARFFRAVITPVT